MCVHYLQPLRNDTQNIIEPLSGIRSLELNTAIKGEINSDHLFKGFYSCAVDFIIHAFYIPNPVWNVDRVIDWFLVKGGFKQLIWYSKKNFFHFAPFTLTPKEKQILIF